MFLNRYRGVLNSIQLVLIRIWGEQVIILRTAVLKFGPPRYTKPSTPSVHGVTGASWAAPAGSA